MTTATIDQDYHTNLHKEPETLPHNRQELKYTPPGGKITLSNAEASVAKSIQMSAENEGKPVFLIDPNNEIGKVIIAPKDIGETANYHARVTEEIKEALASKDRPNGKGTDAIVTSPEKALAIHI